MKTPKPQATVLDSLSKERVAMIYFDKKQEKEIVEKLVDAGFEVTVMGCNL